MKYEKNLDFLLENKHCQLPLTMPEMLRLWPQVFFGAQKWIPCSAHTINLLVKDALASIKKFDDLIGHVKSIVAFVV